MSRGLQRGEFGKLVSKSDLDKHKEDLERELPNYPGSSKYQKRVLDLARRLAKEVSTQDLRFCRMETYR